MSPNESVRVEILSRVSAGVLTLKQAAQLLGLSYRQAKRLSQRYQRDGSAGLVHRHTGQRSNRAKPHQVRELALDFVRKNAGDGLGPTLVAAELAEQGLSVSHETLRRWMLEAGLWNGSRKRQSDVPGVQSLHFGELVILQGQLCSWPGERRIVNWLMALEDRATETLALRITREPIWALAGLLRSWIERHGLPLAVQIDWDGIGLRQSPAGPWRTGISSVSHFGRMCAALDLPVVTVRSSRIASGLDAHWARLADEFRARSIRDDKAANVHLEQEYAPEHNRRCARQPEGCEDVHRPLASGLDLDAIFRVEEERPISDNWQVEYRGRVYEVQRESRFAPARDKVLVQEWPDRHLEIHYRGHAVKWRQLAISTKSRGHFYRVKPGTLLTSGDARS